MPYGENTSDDWLTVDECAHRLGTTKERVLDLVEHKVLKARWDGGLMVQPALVSGWQPEVR